MEGVSYVNPFPKETPLIVKQWYQGMSFEAATDLCYDQCVRDDTDDDSAMESCLGNCSRLFQQSFLVAWDCVLKNHASKPSSVNIHTERINQEARHIFDQIRRPDFRTPPPVNSDAAAGLEDMDLRLASFTEDPFREIDIRQRTRDLLSARGRKLAAENERLRTNYYKLFPSWPISTGLAAGPLPRYGPTAWRSYGYTPHPPPYTEGALTYWLRSDMLAEDYFFKYTDAGQKEQLGPVGMEVYRPRPGAPPPASNDPPARPTPRSH